MISDVFFETVEQIDQYLNNPVYSATYSGKLREEILHIRSKMKQLQAELDTPPFDGNCKKTHSIQIWDSMLKQGVYKEHVGEVVKRQLEALKRLPLDTENLSQEIENVTSYLNELVKK